MKKYNTYEKYLNSLGYKAEFIGAFCGMLTDVDFYDDKKHHIILSVTPTKKYENYIESLEPDTEYEIDYSQFTVTSAFIECPLCNVSGFTDGSKNGITLSGYKSDIDDEYDENDLGICYYTDRLDIFKKCVWIQNHIMEHEEFILENHLKNLKRIKKEFLPVFTKYGYYQDYSSILDCDDESGYQRYCSSPYIEFKTDTCTIEDKELRVSTNCITGELYFNDKPYNEKDFDKFIFDTVIKDERFGGVKSCFKYLFDSRYNVRSEAEIFHAYQLLRMYKEGHAKVSEFNYINFDDIPYEDNKDIVDEIKKIMSENNENTSAALCV